jgi:hypothetical protein
VAAGGCQISGVLSYFDNSVAQFEAVAHQGEQALLDALSAPVYPSGAPAVRDSDFAGFTTDAAGNLTSAEAAHWVRVYFAYICF